MPTIHYPIVDSELSFADYIALCKTMIHSRRKDLAQHSPLSADDIVEANAPFELLPLNNHHKTAKKGALLIHGLLDCPFSMREVAEQLQERAILSRAILLPGHGTTAADLLHVSYQDWLTVVKYGIDSLAKEVDEIYLVGYSTGAALAILSAMNDARITGILLLAPAIKMTASVDAMAGFPPLVKALQIKSKWSYRDDEIDYVKYRSITINAVMQVYRLTQLVAELNITKLKSRVFMSVSEDDEIISAAAAIDLFKKLSLEHQHQLLLYSNEMNHHANNIIIRKSRYSHLHIKTLSHIAMPFSAANKHYGQNGEYVYASHINTQQYIYGAYNRLKRKVSGLLYEFGIHKRKREVLTYHPDFHFMANEIVKFILK